MKVLFDIEKITRYNESGPRYTSYPTAVAFSGTFTEKTYLEQAELSNTCPIPAPLSLYFHIPFCDTICFYCACNKVVTKDYSKADTYLEYLYREIDMQSALFDDDRIVEQLHWGGGTPTFLNHEQMQALMDYTRSHFNLLDNDEGDYSIEIDPRSVTTETIALLREIGFNRFSLGVQDVNERVQAAVNRIQPIEETLAIINACRANNAKSISIDLIYGLPLQTPESFEETLQTIIGISPDRISLFNYAHLPHLFKPQRRINVTELPPAHSKLDILQHSIETLTAAGYVYIGMDHFAKPDDELSKAQENGELHRNFQGYTTHASCDLVAMGVSAISSVHNSYSQNEKTLDDYYEAIDEEHLPIIKGVRLTPEDVLRREVIQQLSCQFMVDIKRIEKDYGINFMDYFSLEMAELETLAADDLLTIEDDRLVITAAGRLLVRRICMVFDTYLREQRMEQRYSKVI
uniref:Coproporphyrinogen-III oxidase n=1 Tax=uncultured Thiotrichaceae bacterium TaxID=298394 RepID=A0A6S6UMM8_9GAMM|nr:MAG: Coproporphyrinogen III oxidase, oxygen-independent (EC [uncultured Thiotrichaceae bacterium]